MRTRMVHSTHKISKEFAVLPEKCCCESTICAGVSQTISLFFIGFTVLQTASVEFKK